MLLYLAYGMACPFLPCRRYRMPKSGCNYNSYLESQLRYLVARESIDPRRAYGHDESSASNAGVFGQPWRKQFHRALVFANIESTSTSFVPTQAPALMMGMGIPVVAGKEAPKGM